MSSVSDGGGGPSILPEGGSGWNELRRRLARRALLALLIVYPLAQLAAAALLALLRPEGEAEDGLAEGAITPEWILLAFGTNQLTLLASALACNRMRPRLDGGLGLRPSVLSLPLTVLLVLGTPAVYGVGELLGRLSGIHPGPSLRSIERAMFESGELAASVFLVLATVGAAGCEELFFRGFVQRALSPSLRAPLLVFVSGSVFALYHQDPLQIIMVLPVGLWFAFLAYRSRSTWVAMASHLVGNGNSMLLATLAGEGMADGDLQSLDPAVGAFALAVLGLSALALVVGLLRLRNQDRRGSA